MFKLEVKKVNGEIENIYNMNLLSDDFLRFIPRNFGVPKENVKAYAMPDAWRYELEAYLAIGSEYSLDLSHAGKILIIKDKEIVKEYEGKLIPWPYDDSGNFLKRTQKAGL